MSEEINVYVLENEQPYENWFGTWKNFQTINKVSGFYVENNKGDLVAVDEKNVFEMDSNLPILEYIHKEANKEVFIKFGLTEEEADDFQSLLDKMIIPKDSLDHFEEEMSESIPFEGGMFTDEALVGLLLR